MTGESLYTNPPDPNMLHVDAGLEEDFVWAFRMTTYNQSVVTNSYKNNPYSSMSKYHVPFWGHKLMTPIYFREEKYEKFLKQWEWRLGLEQIKLKHALNPNHGDPRAIRAEYQELYDYFNYVKVEQQKEAMRDVYITDHKKKAEKMHTLSEEEDAQFYEYMQSLNNYQKAPEPTRVSQFESGRYPRGSLRQKLFEPLAGARRNADGTLVFEMSERDLANCFSESAMRKEFEKASANEVQPSDEDDEEAEQAMVDANWDELDEGQLPMEDWEALVDKELDVFLQSDKYSYVKDIEQAFAPGQTASLEAKILKTIPDHAFWDIKRPRSSEQDMFVNKFNPSRKYPFESFFDRRNYEQWMHDRETNVKLKEDISRHRRY